MAGEPVMEHVDQYSIHWYVVCAIVLSCLAFFVGLTVCVYRCYKTRSDRLSPAGRLSAAIRGGLMKEYRTGGSGQVSKSPSIRSTASSHSCSSASATSPHDAPQQLICGLPPASGDTTSFYTVNEKGSAVDRSPQEEEGGGKKMPESLGSLQFAVSYDGKKSALIVAINGAKNLPAKSPNHSSTDPYVKLQLLPEKRQKVKTRVVRKTRSPVFDEIFTFYGVESAQLSGISLHFVVLSYDKYSRDDIIGEIVHPLADDELNKAAVPVTREILPRYVKSFSQGRGELLISICHHPAASRLTVVVLKARNLPKMDITGLADPYVKVYLRYNGQRIAKKKTHVKKRTLNPVFNESFLFDLPQAAEPGNVDGILDSISLELLVLDWDQLTKNETIGRLELGKVLEGDSKIGEQELRHWNEVINCPRKQIAGWHKLIE